MIIGISGKAGVGKDTTADYLVDKYGFVKISFADVMKRICMDVFDFSKEQLWGESSKRNQFDDRYISVCDACNGIGFDSNMSSCAKCDGMQETYLSPREALQTLGDWGRRLHKDIWLEYTLKLSKKLTDESGLLYNKIFGVYNSDSLETALSGVVIADCRYLNEVEAVKNSGGKLVRILRPSVELSGKSGQHSSEVDQNLINDDIFDTIIDNCGTIEELYRKIDNSNLIS